MGVKMTAELSLIKHKTPIQESPNKYLECNKFCYDIIIDNMRFTGAWLSGGEEEQKKVKQKIEKGLEKAVIDMI